MKLTNMSGSDYPIAKPREKKQKEYPYGLCIRLDSEQIQKLPGSGSLQPKDVVQIVAAGTVIEATNRNLPGEAKSMQRQSVEIQITHMAMAIKTKAEKSPPPKTSILSTRGGTIEFQLEED